MNAFSSLSNADALLTYVQTVPSNEHVATLALGALFGFLVAFMFGPVVNGSSAFSHTAAIWVQRALTLLLTGVLLLKELVLASLTWKPHEKVSPWRITTSRGISSGTEIIPDRLLISKTHPDRYGTEEDIDFFLSRIDDEVEGKWKCICQNSLGDYLKYEAYCRILKGGKTEYKSVTHIRDATAEEMTDFYLDDERRSRWDSMLAHTEQLEMGSTKDRCEVVRWIRSFPFPFLTDREYIIGRRIFRKNGTVYTISRGIEHAIAPVLPSLVRMDVFYSMWSCRDTACIWGTDKPCCEVVLLHHEQFKIPERLARFAACKGMWGFIKSMGPAMASYIQDRRESSSGSSASGFSPSRSELSFTTSEDSGSFAPRSGKPNKLVRTAGRALVALLVTAIVIKRSHQVNGTQH